MTLFQEQARADWPLPKWKSLNFLAVSDNEDITDVSQTLYKQKFRSLFFGAIAIWPT